MKNDHTELLRLLADLCDEGLGQAEAARLEELLADEDARRVYFEYMNVEARLLSLSGEATRKHLDSKPTALGADSRGELESRGRDRWAQPTLRYLAVVAASVAATML